MKPIYKNQIEHLVGQLHQVEPLLCPNKTMGIWLLLVYPVTAALFFTTGDLRQEFHTQLLELRFFWEISLGFLTAPAAALASFHLARPTPSGLDLTWHKWLLLLPIGFAILALSSLYWPALTPSATGHREHCNIETFLFALWPGVVSLYFLRRGICLHSKLSTFLVVISCGMIPVVGMHLACMYDPSHIWIAHIFPGLCAGSCIALVYNKRIKNSV